jgi:hypothetical protein
MNGDSLPSNLDDLIELENRLLALAVDKPSVEFRQRVLRAAEAELQNSRGDDVPQAWDCWSWMALAAAVLIVLNVSLISASSSEFTNGPSISADSVHSELDAIRIFDESANGKHK